MPDASFALPSLMVFALLFGIKHGFDADHLAAIDGLARMQAGRGHKRLARFSGALFSLGHGVMVLMAAWMLQRYGIDKLPEWLDPVGAWISIVFLFLIGITNLRNALSGATPMHTMSPLARSLMRLPLPHGLAGSMMVGAMFALSFDTMSVAAWFGLAGARHGGVAVTFALALAFVGGMVLTDAINGVMVACLIGRSERFAQRAGRLFSLLVASSALLVCGLGLARFSSEIVSAWAEGKELVFGACVLSMTLFAYALARRVHRASIVVH